VVVVDRLATSWEFVGSPLHAASPIAAATMKTADAPHRRCIVELPRRRRALEMAPSVVSQPSSLPFIGSPDP
jgi:hypothetical protein